MTTTTSTSAGTVALNTIRSRETTKESNSNEFVIQSKYGALTCSNINTKSAFVQCPSQGSSTSLRRVHVSSEDSKGDSSSSIVSISAHKDIQGSFHVYKSNDGMEDHYDTIYNDDTCIHMNITGATGGYLDAEFRDIPGGFDQIVFLPDWDCNYDVSSTMVQEDPMGVLQLYLEHCIMIDGSHVFYCRDNVDKIERKQDGKNDIVSIALKRVIKTPHTTSQKRKYITINHDEDTMSIKRVDRKKETSTVDTKAITSERPWQKTFRKGLEQRLQNAIRQEQQKRNMQIVQNKLLERSQQILMKLSQMDDKKGYDQSIPLFEMMRSKYLVESSHVPNSNSIGVQIHLEVDVYYTPTKRLQPNDLHQVFDVQLSAVPDCELNGDTSNIYTCSGLVPTWNQGDCFRLSTLVHISEMKIPNDTHFGLHLNIFFRHPEVDIPMDDIERAPKMTGCVLGSILVPLEEVLTFQKDGSFTKVHSCTSDPPIYPTAHFDYREPKTLILDTSKSCSALSGQEWQDLSSSINHKCAPRCRIDVVVDSSIQSKVQLSLFAPSPKERSILMSLVHDKIPDDVIILGETSSITKAYAQSSFLQAAKSELKLLHKYANKPKGSTMTQVDVANIFAAQSITDEALARIHEQNYST